MNTAMSEPASANATHLKTMQARHLRSHSCRYFDDISNISSKYRQEWERRCLACMVFRCVALAEAGSLIAVFILTLFAASAQLTIYSVRGYDQECTSQDNW